ncbi:MAG: polysaccharide biosynthesis C-terminal domain-containing protein [Anaerolineae bacterium]|nr:polysaccharide biosynthesis C-terminal domain-containing protein [Anaerolineae bacterium]
MLRDSTFTLVTRVIIFVIALLNSVIISRVLGPAQKGSLSIILLILSLAQLIMLFGIGSANVFLGAGKREVLPALAGNSLLLAFGLGGIGILLVTVATFLVPVQTYLLANGIEPMVIRVTIWVLPAVLLFLYLQEIVRAAGRLTLYNLLSILFVAAYFICLVGLLLPGGGSLNGAVVARVVSYLVVAVVVVLLVLRLLSGRMRLDRPIMAAQFRFGLRLYPGNLAQFLNYRLDLLFVGLFLSPTEVGLYATATMLAERLWEFPTAIRTVLLYRVASMDSAEKAAELTARVCRIVFLTLGLACLAFALIAYPLVVLLYGTAFAPAAVPLMLLMPGVWLLGIGKLLAIHMAGSGQPEVGTYSALLSLLVTVALDLALIPIIGINGAALASTVSYSIATVYLVFSFRRQTGVGAAAILLVQRRDLALLWQAVRAAGLRLRHSGSGA